SDFFEYARPSSVYFPATSEGSMTLLSSTVSASMAGNCFPTTCAVTKAGVPSESSKRMNGNGLMIKKLVLVSLKNRKLSLVRLCYSQERACFFGERRIDRLSIERSNPACLFRNRTPLSLARCCFRCPDMEKSKKHVLFRKAEACCSAVEVRYATSAEVAADTIGGRGKIHVLDCAKHGTSFFDGGDGLRRIALHDHC